MFPEYFTYKSKKSLSLLVGNSSLIISIKQLTSHAQNCRGLINSRYSKICGKKSTAIFVSVILASRDKHSKTLLAKN